MKRMLQALLTLLVTLLMTQSLLQAEYLENATPPAKDFDWMELESGEWLKGEFNSMYSGDVEFDSDEFDVVTFELEDVKQIITKGTSVISLNRERTSLTHVYAQIKHRKIDMNEIIGKIIYKDKQFSVILPDGSIRPVPMEDIASISGGEPTERNYWSASIFFGIDVLTGNSQQITATAKAFVQRRTASTRFIANYINTYTEVDRNTTTADNNRFNSSFDFYQTAHFYYRLASVEYLRDPFRNIASKYTLAIGVGYDIIYTPSTDWSLTAGPGYQYTSYSDYNPNDPNSVEYADTPLFFLNSRFNTEVTNDIDFIINYNAYFVNTDSGRYSHHAEVALETEIINDFTVDVSVFWDRTEEPIAFSNGSKPEKNDFKTMLAIGYSY